MTTTVLTLTITGLAADSSLAGGSNPRAGRRLASILFLIAGAAAGAWLLKWTSVAPLAFSALCALAAAIVWHRLPAESAAEIPKK